MTLRRLSEYATATGWSLVDSATAARTEWRHGVWTIVVRWTGRGQARIASAGLYERRTPRSLRTSGRHRDIEGSVLDWMDRSGILPSTVSIETACAVLVAEGHRVEDVQSALDSLIQAGLDVEDAISGRDMLVLRRQLSSWAV